MLRVGIPVMGSVGWLGGYHYMKNLLYAIHEHCPDKLEMVVLGSKQLDPKVEAELAPLANIEKSHASAVQFNYSPACLAIKKLGWRYYFDAYLKGQGINVLSHSGLTGRRTSYGIVNWIPDFQHLRLPEMFSKAELATRNRVFDAMLSGSDLVIVSSTSALRDMEEFFPMHAHRGRVLHFVAQPKFKPDDCASVQELERKYGFSGRFFYLPNQFWKHKNHMTALKAIKLLKDRGITVQVLMSGHTEDYRNKQYMSEIRGYVADAGIAVQVHILGLIDYADVFCLMRHSVATINPSYFEGWSTTVEEVKSLGKSIILSDIEVHREQAPPGGMYFPPESHEALADQISKAWQDKSGGPEPDLETHANADLPKQTARFAMEYSAVIQEAGQQKR